MDNSFFALFQKLELIAFFSAYPLLYTIIKVLAGNSKKEIIKKIPLLLPYAYALVGTLYLGFLLRNLYPDYTLESIRSFVQLPVLILWALLSLFFWIPALAKKPVISLLHSLVFFFLLLKDLFFQIYDSSVDKSIVRNEMKVYTDSILLNTGALIVIVIIYLLIRNKKNRFFF